MKRKPKSSEKITVDKNKINNLTVQFIKNMKRSKQFNQHWDELLIENFVTGHTLPCYGLMQSW